MATPSEKLARSLVVLRTRQDRGVGAIRAADLSRVHRERMIANGFLREMGTFTFFVFNRKKDECPHFLKLS